MSRIGLDDPLRYRADGRFARGSRTRHEGATRLLGKWRSMKDMEARLIGS